MISEVKYYQLKTAIKYRIFGYGIHNYWNYNVNKLAQLQRPDVAQTIIFAREIRAQFILNVA